MSLDPQQSLQLAFQHLDTFSVPGVGTFRRTYFGAVIDHQRKKINPPSERFVLEKGDSFQEKLVDFYFRYLDLKIDRARELVDEVGTFVMEELRKAGRLILPGWGELRNANGDEIDFVHDDSLLSGTDRFFGLQPVGYSLGNVMAANEGQKGAAAAAGHESNTTRVEPPPPPRRKRKGRAWIFIVLFLLLLGSGAGVIWPDKFMDVLHQIGLVGDGDEKVASQKKVSTDPVVPDTSGAIDMEPKLVDPSQPTENNEKDDLNERPGEFADYGTYYLIVAATMDASEARRLSSGFRQLGVQPTIVKSRGRGFYKISVYQDKDKDQVIAKMVEWKNKFPDKSWIYWPGM